MILDNSQLLLLAGILVLAWVMLRSSTRRRRGRDDSQQWLRQLRSAASAPQGATLANAPPDVARLEGALIDLQRELVGELETRAQVVRTLLRQVDERIESLRRVQAAASGAAGAAQAWQGDALRLWNSGWPAAHIARHLMVPQGDVELVLAIAPAHRSEAVEGKN